MKLKTFAARAHAALIENKRACETADARALALATSVMLFAVLIAPGVAAAAPWDGVGSSVLAIFTGGLSRTIAIIACIACGVAGLFGKLSWDWAIKIVVGIALIFGSTAIVDYFIGATA